MPTNTLDTNLSAINSISRRYFIPKLADNITTSMALLMKLEKKGKMTTVDGGTDIRQPVRMARNTSIMNYSGDQTLNTSYQEKKFAFIWNWKQKNAPIVVTGLDKLKNAGQAKVIDHVKSETQIAEEDIKDSFATGIYSAGTDPLEIDGARVFLSTSNTYGGINQSTNSWAQAKIDSTTTTLSLAKMQERYEACSEPPIRPDLITTTETMFNAFHALLTPVQRFSNTETANAGFSNLLFRGAEVLEDSYCPTGYMIFWNLGHLELRSASSRKFPGEFVDFDMPINQDVMVAHLRWAGNLTCDNPRYFGAMTALVS